MLRDIILLVLSGKDPVDDVSSLIVSVCWSDFSDFGYNYSNESIRQELMGMLSDGYIQMEGSGNKTKIRITPWGTTILQENGFFNKIAKNFPKVN